MEPLTKKPGPAMRVIMTLLLAGIGIWMYAPALALPLSLVDDYLMLMNLDRWHKDIAEHGYKYAVQHDISVHQRVYNTGFWILGALKLKLSGEQPFHWLRMLELAVVCTMLFQIIRVATDRRNAGFYVAGMMVAVFLMAEVPGAADLQALRMNWFRLFTSDADALVYTSIFAFAVITMMAGVAGKRRGAAAGWGIAAVVFGCIAFSMKLPFAAVVLGPLAVVAVVAFLSREREIAGWTGGVALAVVGVCMIYNVVLRGLNAGADAQTYADSFTLTGETVKAGLNAYGQSYWKLFGPLLVAVAALLPWALVTMWRERHGEKKTMFLALVFMLSVMGCSMVIYLPWSPQLARYMLAGVFAFLVVAGIVGTLALQAMAQVWRSRPVWLLLGLTGVAATVINPWLLVVLSVAAGTVAVIRRAQWGVPFLCGVGIVGCLYIAAVAPAVRSSAEHVYLNREKAGWEAALTLLKYSAQGRNVCFVGNTSDEMIGSMAGHVMRMGVEPRVFAATDAANCGPGSAVMTLQWVSAGEELISATAGRRIVSEFGAVDGEFPVPVSFWTARDRFWQNPREAVLVDYWKSEYVWRFYE